MGYDEAPIESVLALVYVFIVSVLTVKTIRLELVIGLLVALLPVGVISAFTNRKQLLLFLLSPSSPVFHSVKVLSFARGGLTASCDIDLEFKRLWFIAMIPLFTLSLDETEMSSNYPMLEVSLAFVRRGIHVYESNLDKPTNETAAATTRTTSTVELVHLTLSNPISFTSKSGSILKIKQDNMHISIHNESDFLDLIKLLMDIENATDDVVLDIGIRGSLKLFGFITLYKGVFPPSHLNLTKLHQSADPNDDQELIPTRPPGFTGILPGVTFHKSPLTNEGVQLTLDASLTFTYPPALDLRLHEIEFGVYLNRKMITTGLISPFHIEANQSYGVAFFITFNNPKTLRSINLGSVVMDVTGLVSRALGFGIGVFETVILETARMTTGAAVSSQVHIKVLKVKGYDSLGGVVEVEWLGKLLRGIENLGSDFSVFGGGSGPAGGSRAFSPTPPNYSDDSVGDEYLY
ncbi:hypothetical protein BDR26DRAFT_854908 [Obelidium mucronatum]|nr:hypothetical protein BDR26DRAFT_854908 [Obelidium mucronatum]